MWALETFDFPVFTVQVSGAPVWRVNWVLGCLEPKGEGRAHAFQVHRAELQIQKAVLKAIPDSSSC